MRLKHLLFVLLAASGAPLCATTSDPPPSGAPDLAVSKPALELASIAMPLDSYIQREMRIAREGFLALPRADADAKALEAEFPGLYEHSWKAVEPEMRRSAVEGHPKLLTRLAGVYQQHLTLPEIEAVRVFYLTPTGQRVLSTMYREVDAAPLVQAMVKHPDGMVSAEALGAAQKPALDKVRSETGPADEAASRSLLLRVSPSKLQALGRAVRELTVAWVNEEDPALDARIEKVLTSAMEQYMDRSRSNRN